MEAVTTPRERHTQTSSEAFSDDVLASIQVVVEAVTADVYDGSTKHTEVGRFNATIAEELSQYKYEGGATGVDTADIDETTAQSIVN